MLLPIVRLVLICKAMDLAHKATEFTKNQADLRCLAHQNKLDNGQRHRVSHPVIMTQCVKLDSRLVSRSICKGFMQSVLKESMLYKRMNLYRYQWTHVVLPLSVQGKFSYTDIAIQNVSST